MESNKKRKIIYAVGGVVIGILLASTITMSALYATKQGEAQPTTYSVIYSDNGNTIHSERVVEGGDVKNVPSNPIKTGYQGSWSSDGKNIREDTVIYSKYVANEYNVAVTMNHVTNPTALPSKVVYGEVTSFYFQAITGYTLPNNVVVSGASYEWNQSSGKLSVYSPISDVAIAVTGEEIPEIKVYCSVFYVASDSTVYSEIVEYGNDVVNVPAVPEKPGYSGVWNQDGKNITTDTVIYAVYTPNTYSLTVSLTNAQAVVLPPVTITGADTVELKFEASDFYQLPTSITVSGATYYWQHEIGLLFLSNATSDVSVSIVAEYEPQLATIHCLQSPGAGSYVQIGAELIYITEATHYGKVIPGQTVSMYAENACQLIVKKYNDEYPEGYEVYHSLEDVQTCSFVVEFGCTYYLEFGFNFS